MTLMNKNYNIAILFIFILFMMPKSYCNNLTAYHYFQGMIDESNDKLEALLNGENTTPIQANIFNVSEDLKEYEINVTLLNISPTFKEFYIATNNIIINYNKMIKYRNVSNLNDYVIFKISLKNAKNNLELLNHSIQKIDNITLKYENKSLKFNTENIKKTINELNSELNIYVKKLDYINPRGFFIYSNKETAFLNSNITIYGYIDTKKPINITIFYDNTPYTIESINGMFSKNFTINRTGNHTFYAKYDSRTSNIIKIKCIKIPTYFDIKYNKEEYILSPAKVEVHLYDYYKNEINASIYVNYQNKTLELKAPCTLYIKGTSERILPIEFTFLGNSLYSSTKKVIYINFTKIPTYINARYEHNKIVGTLTDFNGNKLNNKSIYLIVNNKTYSITKTYNGSFEFLFTKDIPKECKVVFKGDSIYKPSEKIVRRNLLFGLIAHENYNMAIFIFIISIIISIAITIKIKSKNNDLQDKKSKEKRKTEKEDIYDIFIKLIENKKYFEGIVKTYNIFIKILGAPKYLTPREICKTYKIVGLEKITKIFEKVYYGNKKPKRKDINEYRRYFKSLRGVTNED
ncbi:hypothetical protein [Methanotorris igneus]|uniref:DUF4129 domain-containing protein n=1 Tax=Methanotorris igneus (strain DSM 5666 / JCM 11834 / Kol 5) TaxID=880724 RepID=F6BAW3_METIK|nr:hypothetical protein [Methanotorris igneus]AEF97050.1 hypothetical protein Metig_1516 [Methanotorris igneus Kol 5]